MSVKISGGVEGELLRILNQAPQKPKEDRRHYLERLARSGSTEAATDEQWAALSEEAQSWVEGAIHAMKDQREIPELPDPLNSMEDEEMQDPETEDAETQEEDSDESEEVDSGEEEAEEQKEAPKARKRQQVQEEETPEVRPETRVKAEPAVVGDEAPKGKKRGRPRKAEAAEAKSEEPEKKPKAKKEKAPKEPKAAKPVKEKKVRGGGMTLYLDLLLKDPTRPHAEIFAEVQRQFPTLKERAAGIVRYYALLPFRRIKFLGLDPSEIYSKVEDIQQGRARKVS